MERGLVDEIVVGGGGMGSDMIKLSESIWGIRRVNLSNRERRTQETRHRRQQTGDSFAPCRTWCWRRRVRGGWLR